MSSSSRIFGRLFPEGTNFLKQLILSVVDFPSDTSLHKVAKSNDIAGAKWLMRQRAMDPLRLNKKGLMAHEVAKLNGNDAMSSLLEREARLHLQIYTHEGVTPPAYLKR